jgi:hypothetical protein
LVVVDGPLRQSEHELLETLGAMEKRLIICLNKSDWYTPEDREKLLGQIRRQASAFAKSNDVVAIQAEVGHRTRRTVMADGTSSDETVETPPDISLLADRMIDIVRTDGKDLLMSNVLLQSRGLVEKARVRVKEALDRQAGSIVDKYMWGAGGVAAISPTAIDLLATSAIATKMILDLADVYHQKVDLETARMWLSEMGKNLIGVLGAHGATVAVSSVIASMVKGVPLLGTIAGGLLQGVIQALITKWIGSVFIEYFRNEMQAPEGGLAGLARRQWEIVTSVDEMRKLVQTARQRLTA